MAKPKLIILGTGFGAFSVVKGIDDKQYDVIVVSPRNYFLFTPLLPSTTVGTVEFRSIIESIRASRSHIQYYQALCTAIDTEKHCIRCENEFDRTSFTLEYDILVIAVGANSNTYGIPGVEQYALFLKELSDARAIRQQIAECFERASIPRIESTERKRFLQFVIVGGGPTGIELAAEMHDFLVEDLSAAFPRLMDDVRIIVLEVSHHILNTFDAVLSRYTLKHFQRQRIEVRTESVVTKVDSEHVQLKDGSIIPYGLLVWSAGNGPQLLTQSIPFEKDEHSRILVDEYFHVKGHANIYAIGDCATLMERNLSATAQIAEQEGKYLARALNTIARKGKVRPIHLRNFGMLAYIGGNKALADLATIKGRGYTTWLFWRSVYLTKLVSVKNKTLVLFDWIKTRIFGRDISRF